MKPSKTHKHEKGENDIQFNQKLYQILRQSSNTEEKITIFNELLTDTPSKNVYKKVLLFNAIGECFLKQNEYENAIHNFEEAIKLCDYFKLDLKKKITCNKTLSLVRKASATPQNKQNDIINLLKSAKKSIDKFDIIKEEISTSNLLMLDCYRNEEYKKALDLADTILQMNPNNSHAISIKVAYTELEVTKILADNKKKQIQQLDHALQLVYTAENLTNRVLVLDMCDIDWLTKKEKLLSLKSDIFFKIIDNYLQKAKNHSQDKHFLMEDYLKYFAQIIDNEKILQNIRQQISSLSKKYDEISKLNYYKEDERSDEWRFYMSLKRIRSDCSRKNSSKSHSSF